MRYPKTPQEVLEEMLLAEGGPNVGIFWLDGNELVPPMGLAEPAREVPVYHGFVATEFAHADEWEKIRKHYPQFEDKDYDEVPRGRVLLDKNKNAFIVYVPPNLIDDADVKEAILRGFNLPRSHTEFLPDLHYSEFSDIDWEPN